MTELEHQLLEELWISFFYGEYIGTDKKANAAQPISRSITAQKKPTNLDKNKNQIKSK